MTGSELESTFNSASSDWGRVNPQVWGPAGQSLAFALRLRPGDTVLDVCCGAGASALPAAAAVGPNGRVHAIDLADDLMEQGRVIAFDRALQNIDFVHADVTAWEPPSTVPAAGYDALASSYGVFFLPNMDRTVARLVRLVRPGGRVGVSVWAARSLDEFTGAFFEVLGRYRSDAAPTAGSRTRAVESSKEAAGRIDTPATLADWLGSLGLVSVDVTVLSNLIPATAEFAWNMVLGSGLRAGIAPLDAATVDVVRSEFLDLIVERGIHTVDATTLVGTGSVADPHGGQD